MFSFKKGYDMYHTEYVNLHQFSSTLKIYNMSQSRLINK